MTNRVVFGWWRVWRYPAGTVRWPDLLSPRSLSPADLSSPQFEKSAFDYLKSDKNELLKLSKNTKWSEKKRTAFVVSSGSMMHIMYYFWQILSCNLFMGVCLPLASTSMNELKILVNMYFSSDFKLVNSFRRYSKTT